jgi:hypothetical protein
MFCLLHFICKKRRLFVLGVLLKGNMESHSCFCIRFFFCSPTFLYTHIHTRLSKHKVKNPTTGKSHYEVVPVASEVHEGWWVGGCYGHELDKDWGGVIDLTVEVSLSFLDWIRLGLSLLFSMLNVPITFRTQFPESCRERTQHYLSAPTWDGIPLPIVELDRAARFAVEARKDGEVLVHW